MENIFLAKFAHKEQIIKNYLQSVANKFAEIKAFDMRISNNQCIALVPSLNFKKISGVKYHIREKIYNKELNQFFYLIEAKLDSLDFLYKKAQKIFEKNLPQKSLLKIENNHIIIQSSLDNIENYLSSSNIKLHLIGYGNTKLKVFNSYEKMYSAGVLLDNQNEKFINSFNKIKSGNQYMLFIKILPNFFDVLNKQSNPYNMVALECDGVIYFTSKIHQLLSALKFKQEFRLCECSEEIANKLIKASLDSVPPMKITFHKQVKRKSILWELILMIFCIVCGIFLSRRKIEQMIMFILLCIFYKMGYDYTYIVFVIHSILTRANRLYGVIILAGLGLGSLLTGIISWHIFICNIFVIIFAKLIS